MPPTLLIENFLLSVYLCMYAYVYTYITVYMYRFVLPSQYMYAHVIVISIMSCMVQ